MAVWTMAWRLVWPWNERQWVVWSPDLSWKRAPREDERMFDDDVFACAWGRLGFFGSKVVGERGDPRDEDKEKKIGKTFVHIQGKVDSEPLISDRNDKLFTF